jgi:glycosyltransferase involved in cell wall biosynthesis
MADGLQRLLENPQERRELGERGRELVERKYSRTAYREKLERFYAAIGERVSINRR